MITLGEFCNGLGLSLTDTKELVQLILDKDRARAAASDARMLGWGNGRWQGTALRAGKEELGEGLVARLDAHTLLRHMEQKDAEIRREGSGLAMDPEYLSWILKKAPGCRAKYVPGKIMVGFRGPERRVVKRY